MDVCRALIGLIVIYRRRHPIHVMGPACIPLETGKFMQIVELSKLSHDSVIEIEVFAIFDESKPLPCFPLHYN